MFPHKSLYKVSLLALAMLPMGGDHTRRTRGKYYRYNLLRRRRGANCSWWQDVWPQRTEWRSSSTTRW